MTFYKLKKVIVWKGFNLTFTYISYDYDDCEISAIQFENKESIFDYFTDERIDQVQDYFYKVMRENTQIEERMAR